MKRIAHISDPHFGHADPRIAATLLAELNALQPALVAISGDLTQRARATQFREARAWLDQLTVPYLVVPGNHDIPLYDVVRRLFLPRDRYREYISSDLAPIYADDQLAVCGIDTTKSLTVKDGHISREQAERVAAQLAPYTNHWRVVVAHHPFEHSTGGARAIPLFEAAGVDLVLTGHLHLRHLTDVAGRNPQHTMIAVHAGTCMSKRLRGEPNGYNQLAFDGEHVTITHREWLADHFVDVGTKQYRRTADRCIVKEAETPLLLPLGAY